MSRGANVYFTLWEIFILKMSQLEYEKTKNESEARFLGIIGNSHPLYVCVCVCVCEERTTRMYFHSIEMMLMMMLMDAACVCVNETQDQK